MKQPSDSNGRWNAVGLGVAFGAGLGIVAGLILSNIGLWLAIGAGLGVVLGAVLAQRR